MSGIVGIVGSREPIDTRTVTAMRDRIAHRGPDDAGLAFAPDGRTAFGHRRLAIFEPTAAGHEPMWNRARTLLVATDGGITNFHELASELSISGYTFATRSPTEVLLAAFEHWGLDAVERLRGAFAFALCSEEAGECLLARDRLGVKPLYYAVIDNTLHFASEAIALLEAPGLSRDLDWTALGDYLAYGYVPGERSIWRDIRKLPPAHILLFRRTEDGRSETEIRRYWAPPTTPNLAGTDPSQLKSALTEAVRLAMIADVPVGALLSSGLDSSVLVALMGSTGEPVRSYSFDFNGHANGGDSQAASVRRVAQRYAAEHHERHLALDRSLDTLAQVVESYDEPLADESIVESFLLAEDMAGEMKLAVSSAGAGMLFGEEESTSRPPRAPRDLDQLFRQVSFFDAPARRALVDPAIAVEMDDDVLRIFRPHWRPELPEAMRFRLVELHTALADSILTRIDRASMHHALEMRLPLLDHRVVEEALSPPIAASPPSRAGRDLLRALARELLPDEDRVPSGRRRSWIHAAPGRLGGWLSRRVGREPGSGTDWGMNAERAARLRSGELARHGFVQRAAIDRLLARPSSRNRKRAWSLLVLDLWLETHLR